MADLIPLFPLPNVVLFPNVFLPLHIFEPRYREMIADALASDRVIGMALLRPGWEADYEGRPPIYAVGCTGVITHTERLPDGRYNIILRGMERVRILEVDERRSYRRATVEALTEVSPSDDDRAAVRALRDRLEALVVPAGGDARIATGMPDEDIVNGLAQYLDLDAIEKQALLEHDSVRSRAQALVELLEMKILMGRVAGEHPRVTH